MTDDSRKPPPEWYTHPDMSGMTSYDEGVSRDTVTTDDGTVLSAYWQEPESIREHPNIPPWGGLPPDDPRQAIDEQLSHWPTTDYHAPLFSPTVKWVSVAVIGALCGVLWVYGVYTVINPILSVLAVIIMVIMAFTLGHMKRN